MKTTAEIIKEAKARLPEPEIISTKYYTMAVTAPKPFPSLDFLRLVEFQKVSIKGKLSWEFKSIT